MFSFFILDAGTIGELFLFAFIHLVLSEIEDMLG